MNDASSACAIVVAAGRSERMAGTDKIFAQLKGRPLIAWTLGAFVSSPSITSIVVVASEPSLQRMGDLVVDWRFDRKVVAIVAGGATRQASVAAGLEAAPAAANLIAIHDGARPLVTAAIIDHGVALAREHGAAVCAVPARDTVKEVAGEPPRVTRTPDRTTVWLAQTPQVFQRDLLQRAHAAAQTELTDDAGLVEGLGEPVFLYEGATSNMKITTADDLVVAEAMLQLRFADA